LEFRKEKKERKKKEGREATTQMKKMVNERNVGNFQGGKRKDIR